MDKLTAAHRTYAFNTWLRVHNLDNGKTVDVRIIDRGPFVRGRIVDLSRAAAQAIDMIGPGLAKVKLEVIEQPPQLPPPDLPPAAETAATIEQTQAPRFAVQVGSFRDKDNAENLRAQMEQRYGTARLVMRDGSPPQWRVLVGSFESTEEAESLASELRGLGEAGFAVRLDPDIP